MWNGIPKKFTPQKQKHVGDPAVVAKTIAMAGIEALRFACTAASEAIQHGFSTPEWPSSEGIKITGVCEKITRMNATYHISLMRCTRSNIGDGGARCVC